MPVPSTPPRSGESTLERAFRPPPGLPEPSVAECFVPPESEDDIAASSACPLARMREAVSRIGFGAEALQRRAENYRVPFFGTRVSTSNAGPVLNLNPAEHISQVYEVGFEERAGRSEFVSLVASSLSELTVSQLFDKLQAQVKYGPGREAFEHDATAFVCPFAGPTMAQEAMQGCRHATIHHFPLRWGSRYRSASEPSDQALELMRVNMATSSTRTAEKHTCGLLPALSTWSTPLNSSLGELLSQHASITTILLTCWPAVFHIRLKPVRRNCWRLASQPR